MAAWDNGERAIVITIIPPIWSRVTLSAHNVSEDALRGAITRLTDHYVDKSLVEDEAMSIEDFALFLVAFLSDEAKAEFAEWPRLVRGQS